MHHELRLLMGLAFAVAFGHASVATFADKPAAAAQVDDVNSNHAKSPPSRTLGIRVVDEPGGLLVTEVSRESVAGHAGLRVGDRITKLDGRPIRSHDDFVADIRRGARQAGLLIIVRDGASLRIPLNWTSGPVRRTSGYRGSNDETKYNGVGNGLRILRIDEGSWAQSTGLLPNDRIVSVNKTPVTTKAHLIALLQDSAGSSGIGEIAVDRAGMPTTLELHLPQATTARNSLTDVANIIGAHGSLDAATGNTKGSLGTYGVPKGTGATTTSSGTSTSGTTTNDASPSGAGPSSGTGAGASSAAGASGAGSGSGGAAGGAGT